jgi:hypothetical protein
MLAYTIVQYILHHMYANWFIASLINFFFGTRGSEVEIISGWDCYVVKYVI